MGREASGASPGLCCLDQLSVLVHVEPLRFGPANSAEPFHPVPLPSREEGEFAEIVVSATGVDPEAVRLPFGVATPILASANSQTSSSRARMAFPSGVKPERISIRLSDTFDTPRFKSISPAVKVCRCR